MAPLTEPRNEVGRGGQGSPSRRSSLGYWSSNLSRNQFGGAAFEPPSHYVEYDDDAGEEQPLIASSHPTKMEVDNLAMVLHCLFGDVVPDKPPSLSVGA